MKLDNQEEITYWENMVKKAERKLANAKNALSDTKQGGMNIPCEGCPDLMKESGCYCLDLKEWHQVEGIRVWMDKGVNL